MLAIALVSTALLAHAGAAHGQPPASAPASAAATATPGTGHRLRQRNATTGSNIREEFVRSRSLPLDRPYAKFTAQEKADFKAQYEPMAEDDEPPFPEHGLEEILTQVSKYAGHLRATGDTEIHVTVDIQGKATEFALVRYPSMEFARAVAYVLNQSTYKPAVCGGRPCVMQFPFRVRFN